VAKFETKFANEARKFINHVIAIDTPLFFAHFPFKLVFRIALSQDMAKANRFIVEVGIDII
jgi:hypothetical protein